VALRAGTLLISKATRTIEGYLTGGPIVEEGVAECTNDAMRWFVEKAEGGEKRRA